MICPLNCKKLQHANKEINRLDSTIEMLQGDVKEKERNMRNLESLGRLSEMGYYLVSLIEKDGEYYVAVLPNDELLLNRSDIRTAYLFHLPHCNMAMKLGFVYFKFHANHSVEIIDIIMANKNRGYGTMLLNSIISFARAAGFQHVYGSICPVDLEREKMLRHFYSKLGFKITDAGEVRELNLDLTKKL